MTPNSHKARDREADHAHGPATEVTETCIYVGDADSTARPLCLEWETLDAAQLEALITHAARALHKLAVTAHNARTSA